MNTKIIIVALLISASIVRAENRHLVLGCAEPPDTSKQMKRTELILKEALGRIGYSLELKALPSARSILSSNQGLLDGEAQRIYNLNELYKNSIENLIRVPEPHQTLVLTAFTYNRDDIVLDRQQPYKTIKNYDTLFKIGIVATEKSIVEHSLTKVWRVPDYRQMFRMLILGRAEIAIGFPELLEGKGLLTEKEFAGKPFRMLEPPVNTLPLYLYLHKKHKLLVPRVAQALKEMKKDGTFDKVITEQK